MMRIPEGYHFTRKAVAYLVYDGNLLVSTQPRSSEAGLQVPAGTVEKGERPQDAVVREVYEETGLEQIQIVRGIATSYYDMSAFRKEIQERHFFQISVDCEVRECWRHYERYAASDPLGAGIPFDFHWANLSLPISLMAGQGDFLDSLR